MNPVKLALLSAAHIHTRGYLEEIERREDCELAVLWDDVEQRGARFAGEFGCRTSAELDRVIERDDIDGFLICAENTRHVPLLQATLPTGKPVFCEKPLTTSGADAAAVMDLVETHDAALVIGYFQPLSAAMQGVGEALREELAGRITHARFRNAHHAAYGRWFDAPELAWFHDPKLAGGGAFMDMGSHAVHLLCWLFGEVTEASAAIGNAAGIYSAVDDHGTALLRFASGILATVEASWVQTGGAVGFEVTGSEGTIYRDPALGYVLASPGKDPIPIPEGEAKPTRLERLLAVIRGEIAPAEIAQDLEIAADTVAVMEACYASQANRRWVAVGDS